MLLKLVYTPYLTPQHQTQEYVQEPRWSCTTDTWRSHSSKCQEVIWHREDLNGDIHLLKYGVTSQKTHYLLVLRFSWWHHFRLWSSTMWCCITGWGAPARDMFLQNAGSLGSPNGMTSHPRILEYLRNVIFTYKLSAHYWCVSIWIITSYVPRHMKNWPNPPTQQTH